MFYWIGKKKYDLADAQCEDSLTSSVFERLLLLSDENLWWVLRNACDKQAATTLPDNVGKLEKFEFWPSWEPDLKLERNSLRVEPDVFLRFEGLDILVEAKRYDFVQSQREEQWQNELAAWFQEFKSDRPVLLLAIGGNTSVGSRSNFAWNSSIGKCCVTLSLSCLVGSAMILNWLIYLISWISYLSFLVLDH